MHENPLLRPWDGPFQTPRFDQIVDDDFMSAFSEAMKASRSSIDAIARNPEEANFTNTIEALELSEDSLRRVFDVFSNLADSDSNEQRRGIERKIAPQLADHVSETVMNQDLFDRIERVWNQRESEVLTAEQFRVLEFCRRNFVRSGAALQGETRQRFAKIKSRLAEIGTAFSQNLLADEANWWMPITEDQISGLPAFVIDAAREAASARGIDGYAITLNRSHIEPFLQFSQDRALRKKAVEAWNRRGMNSGDTDNQELIAETLRLRNEMAELLGFPSYAAYKLETEMAKTPDAVRKLLDDVWEPAREQAEKDARILQASMKEDGIDGCLEPWDWRFYSERRRRSEHDLDESEIQRYFQLDLMREAAFECASRLFGLSFHPLDIPLYHPDCLAWEMRKDGRRRAVFIGDYFARASKRSGAWCSSFQNQRKVGGERHPVVVNVCNFAKPAEGQPCLLSFNDARTLFHEFGHALHALLSDVVYPSVSGTSVARDFVELPSQLFESWLEEPAILSRFALHAETGKPIPDELRDRLLSARNYDQGFATAEYLACAFVDLDFHSGQAPHDPIARQAAVLAEIQMPGAILMRHAAPHFAHVFSGSGYAAAYYSYLWSEIMAADAANAFEESGNAFDQDTARKLETCILSTGGSRPPEDLYIAFRGRLPEVGSLLRKRGFVANPQS